MVELLPRRSEREECCFQMVTPVGLLMVLRPNRHLFHGAYKHIKQLSMCVKRAAKAWIVDEPCFGLVKPAAKVMAYPPVHSQSSVRTKLHEDVRASALHETNVFLRDLDIL